MATNRSFLKTLTVCCLCVCAAFKGERAKAEITGTTLAGSLSGSGVSTIFATHAPGRPNELFVVDQRGFIEILNLETGQFNNQPFLDIQGFVDDGGNEQGLLGLAFDPNYATNGHFYVNYTRDPGPGLDRTRIDRFTAPDPLSGNIVSSGTRSSVLEFEQDFNNHNGGWIGFSPNDGLLYIATGDGGSGNDPNNRSQSLDQRLGKMLRIDVTGDDFPSDSTENYAVPADNPYANDGNGNTLADIWSYGLRNPYRASFDRETGDLWIGDVGQNFREEINFQPADSDGGENYGWRLREGDIATPTGEVGGPAPPDHVPPAYDYSHGGGTFQGNSVVGGYVYRGPDPEVDGRYFFADTVSSRLWAFDPANPDNTIANVESILDPSSNIVTPVSFGEDAVGNLYIVARGGDIYRIETDTLTAGDYTGDGQVDIDDYELWKAEFGQSQSRADGNEDGTVDAADFVIWRDNLTSTPSELQSPINTVPEPTAAAILLLGAVPWGRLRRCPFRFSTP